MSNRCIGGMGTDTDKLAFSATPLRLPLNRQQAQQATLESIPP